MKINFGCGRRVMGGFYNIDAERNPKAPRSPELIYQMKFTPVGEIVEPIPLASGVAEMIQAMHFIEHVFRWEADAVILEFKRLLKPGGRLVLECPNVLLAAKNLLSGRDDQMSMWPLYGDWGHKDPLMMHKHGYQPKTITALLKDCGFQKITVLPPQTHKARTDRDMRVEAVKQI